MTEKRDMSEYKLEKPIEETVIVETEVKKNIARITLNRPEKHNALWPPEGFQVLADALVKTADRDDVKVIILRGAGPSFCSGDDLEPDPVRVLRRHPRPASAAEQTGDRHPPDHEPLPGDPGAAEAAHRAGARHPARGRVPDGDARRPTASPVRAPASAAPSSGSGSPARTPGRTRSRSSPSASSGRGSSCSPVARSTPRPPTTGAS